MRSVPVRSRSAPLRWIAVLGAFAVLAVGAVTLHAHGNVPMATAAGRLAPAVALVDDHGRIGSILGDPPRPTVIYFGYTHCLDNCPVALGTLANARRHLGAPARAIRIDFVTVDPARDTPPVMLAYVRRFGEGVIGYTGTDAQDEAALKAYHVWHQKLAAQRGSDAYLEGHSGGIFYIDGTGRIRQIGDDQDALDATIAKMSAVIP